MSDKNTTETTTSIGRMIFYIFSAVIIVLLALLLFAVIVTKQSGEPIMILKHSVMIIDTENMGDSIPKDSAIILKKVDIDSLSVGDIIAVRDQAANTNAYTTITTQIVRLNPTPEGLTFITKGFATTVEDNRLRTEKDIYGQVISIIPSVGKFLLFVKSPLGLGVCIALPLALLLVIEIINLFRVSRVITKEDLAEANPSTYAEMFGTRSIDFGGKKNKTARSDVPFDADKMSINISQKVRELKQTAVFIPETPLQETDEFTPLTSQQAIKATTTTQEFEVPKSTNGLYDIITRENDADYLEEEEFRAPRQFKIEPKDETRVRITPHKIVTKAEEEAAMLSNKVLSLRDDLYDDEQIIRNMGEFQFSRPDDMIYGANPVQSKRSFLKNKPKLLSRRETQSEFTATVQGDGSDHFNIDGIDVKVKPDALKLNMGDDILERDITITVTDEYTNVIVDSDEYQLNFALFKDADDNEQKVVIKKKTIK